MVFDDVRHTQEMCWEGARREEKATGLALEGKGCDRHKARRYFAKKVGLVVLDP